MNLKVRPFFMLALASALSCSLYGAAPGNCKKCSPSPSSSSPQEMSRAIEEEAQRQIMNEVMNEINDSQEQEGSLGWNDEEPSESNGIDPTQERSQ